MTYALPRRHVAETALALPELGLGTAPVGNLYRPVSDEDAARTLATALDAGIAYADTAPFYGFGLAEQRLGAALAGRSDVVVSTKVGRLLHPADGPLPPERECYHQALPFVPVFDYSHDGVLRSHETSLKRLGRDRIDILYVHDIGRMTHGEAHPAMIAQLVEGGGFRALERLRSEGAISAFGLGVNEIPVCLELMDRARMDVILLAGRYTLLEQEALDVLLPRCLAERVSVVIGGPYNSGILAAGTAAPRLAYNYAPAPAAIIERAQRIEAVCARHRVSVGAAALQFVLAHPAVASVIPGIAQPKEAEETMERYRAVLPAALWEELKAEGLLRADAPTPGMAAAA
ncbi:aldo/keto reductase [Sphingomonas sp.]|uniref:aldo/keto reductase n=1 Tax=Sphingomonas sp. TaxID=28214 RepID=UPI0025F09542|nr:aldo/keto reductase [Sphingomonas sp.]